MEHLYWSSKPGLTHHHLFPLYSSLPGPLLTTVYPVHWPPFGSSRASSLFLLQGLCTSCSFCWRALSVFLINLFMFIQLLCSLTITSPEEPVPPAHPAQSILGLFCYSLTMPAFLQALEICNDILICIFIIFLPTPVYCKLETRYWLICLYMSHLAQCLELLKERKKEWVRCFWEHRQWQNSELGIAFQWICALMLSILNKIEVK